MTESVKSFENIKHFFLIGEAIKMFLLFFGPFKGPWPGGPPLDPRLGVAETDVCTSRVCLPGHKCLQDRAGNASMDQGTQVDFTWVLLCWTL